MTMSFFRKNMALPHVISSCLKICFYKKVGMTIAVEKGESSVGDTSRFLTAFGTGRRRHFFHPQCPSFRTQQRGVRNLEQPRPRHSERSEESQSICQSNH